MRCRKYTRAELKGLVEIMRTEPRATIAPMSDALRERAAREGMEVVDLVFTGQMAPEDLLGLPTRATSES